MGGRRRGLRRQPAPARRPGAAEIGLRARGVHAPRPHPGRRSARRPPGQEDPQAGLAEAVRRTRCEGPPLVRLGPDRRHRPRPARPSAPVDPPQPPHRRARLLPLLCTPPGAALHPREGRRKPLDGRGDVPKLEDPGRAGRAPSPPLDSWHRWVTLALLAHAFLAVTAALERRDQALADDGTSPNGLIPLTCNEIQRLFTALIAGPTLTSPIDCAGLPGADATKPAPNAATTDARPPFNHASITSTAGVLVLQQRFAILPGQRHRRECSWLMVHQGRVLLTAPPTSGIVAGSGSAWRRPTPSVASVTSSLRGCEAAGGVGLRGQLPASGGLPPR
ncbi:hypothetical protein SCANM63S_05397 [Streptomyces canarius]